MSNIRIQSKLDKLHPYCRSQAKKVLKDCKKEGLNVDVFETYRTFERQKWLKSNGKSKTLKSYHRLGLAVDFVFKTKSGNWTWRVSEDKWDRLAEILESNGFASLWKRSGWDGPHGEIRFKGVQTRTLYKEFKECAEDLTVFHEKYITPRLVQAGLWSIPKTSAPKKSEGKETPILDEKIHNQEKPAAKPKRSLLAKLIKFLLSLFGIK